AGERRADRGRRRTHQTRAGADDRNRAPGSQPDVNVSRDDHADHHPGRRGSPAAGGRRGPVVAGVGGQCPAAGGHLVGLSRRPARLDRCLLHRVLHRRAGLRRHVVVTSAEPSPAATPYDTAFCAALNNEHAVIYGYGIVSAHCAPEVNTLVSSALNQHRQRRDAVMATLTGRSVTAPVAAAGYQLPMPVNNPSDAARLAASMEKDTEATWRAVIEQAQSDQDRTFAVTALTQSAVLAAKWKQAQGDWPITTAFPGAD